jgi:4-amino-4-deoxy-L-arabinose transferase-like glycosyltransferase
LAAAWLYALNPNSLFWAGTVMSETLFGFWLALTAYLLMLSQRSRAWWPGAASGLSLGLAVLTRPIGVYLIPLWAIGALAMARGRQGRNGALRRTAVFLLAALLLVFAWQTRNALVHGRFFLANVGSATFTNYIVGYVLEDALDIPREEAVGMLAQAEDRLQYSLDVIRQYPGSFLRVTGRGIFRTLLGTEVGVWLPVLSGLPYSGSGLLSALFAGDWADIVQAVRVRLQAAGDLLGTLLLVWGAIYSTALYLCIVRGWIAVRTRPRPGLGWIVGLLVVSAAYLMLVPLSNGDARFRLPAEPWLAVLGGLAWLGPPRAPGEAPGKAQG